jgi:DNA-binding response OmpR family regulator
LLKRTVHWRWHYRLRQRPHVLIAASDEVGQALRLALQARWLLSIALDLSQALTLASALRPSRILVDESLPAAALLIERLKRKPETFSLPILFLGRVDSQCEDALHRGAQRVVVAGYPFHAGEITAIQTLLLDARLDAGTEFAPDHNCPADAVEQFD